MEAIEELAQLSDSMRQAAAVLADEDVDDTSSSSSSPSRRNSTFLNVVALGNVVSCCFILITCFFDEIYCMVCVFLFCFDFDGVIWDFILKMA